MQTGFVFPKTEGIKYAGSKREIIPSILSIAQKLNVRKVCDGFAGTTRVSQAFSKAGFEVWSNDTSDCSRIMGLCYLKNTKPSSYFQPMIDHLSGLEGKVGWFTTHYGGCGKKKSSEGSDGKKKLWQLHNTMKLDAIRPEIDRLGLDETDQAVLLTSLIHAMDKVDSTVGHQASYLREWAPRAYLPMKMEVPSLILNQMNSKNRVTQADIFEVLKKNQAELYYFDPPYGSSNEKMPPSRVRYASYYHVWTSLIRNDQPKVVGAANRREDVSDKIAASVFEEFRKSKNGRFIAIEAIEKMLKATRGEYVILSYSNQGRATLENIAEVCGDLSKDFTIIEKDHRSHVMRSMRWSREWIPEKETGTKEFLFILGKNGKLPNLSTV